MKILHEPTSQFVNWNASQTQVVQLTSVVQSGLMQCDSLKRVPNIRLKKESINVLFIFI